MRRSCGWVVLFWVWMFYVAAASAQGNAARGKDFTFLYLTQSSVSADAQTVLARKPFDAALAQERQPAFVVVNGGLTRNGTSSDWAKFREVIEGVPQGFPVYALPSSSDYSNDPLSKAEVFSLFYPEGKREVKGRPARGNRIEDRLYQAFDVEGVHIVLLDAAVPQQPHGAYAHLDTEQLNWLDKDLKRLKRDTPIIVFLNTAFGSEALSTRPLANEFELWQVLRPQNVAAIFAMENTTPGERNTLVNPMNGTHIVSLPSGMSGGLTNLVYRVRVTPLRISIDQIHADNSQSLAEVAAFTIPFSTRKSVLKAGFDDDGNPYLVRRHPVGVFEPRAISDNPENETGELRIDEGVYQPMKRDARDIWRNPFRTESLPVGIHTATVHINSEKENRTPHSSEIIFEVERDDREATRRWASNLDNPIVSDPVLNGNTLYVSGMDAKLYALNTLDGKKRTLLTARAGFYASPCFHDGTIYIGSLDKTFYAVNADNGSLKWKFETDAPIYATAAVAQGIVCFGGKGKVYGLDIRTGKPVWTKETTGNLTDFYGTDAATNGDVFVLNRWRSGAVCLEARTGTLRWETPRAASGNTINAPTIASPVIVGSKVCLVLGNTVGVYSLETGKPVRGMETAFDKAISVGGYSTSAASTTAIYLVRNDDKTRKAQLMALSTADGKILWRVLLSQPVIKAGVKLAPDGKSLVVVGVRGTVSVHSTQDGKKLWGYELGPGNVFSTPEYDGQTVYTATMANDVQAINAPGYDARKRAEAKK